MRQQELVENCLMRDFIIGTVPKLWDSEIKENMMGGTYSIKGAERKMFYISCR
jgi:hypothetical protein